MPKSATKKGFSDFEKAAMKERAKEVLSSEKDGESMALAKIAEMVEPDRSIAQKFHGVMKKYAPMLIPKTWYGMPAYATKEEGKIICFFQCANKFKARYQVIGFGDTAHLDEGNLWPNSYALTKLTPTEEKKIVELVKKAIST